MLDSGKWSKGNEKFVLEVRDHIIAECIKQNKNVIVDDTNLADKHIDRFYQLGSMYAERDCKVEVEIKDFTEVDVDECIKRDLARPHSVGERVIRDMYEQFLKPAPIQQDPYLPDAIMCDLDGTLALMGDRNPYDASTCEYDELNYPVYDVLMAYKNIGYKIIICSGRSSEFLPQTDRWLGKHGIKPDLFLMRKEGDVRKDHVVKKEMFMEYIHPNFNVKFVLDDRNRVVNMWRDLGLTVFQVARGDF